MNIASELRQLLSEDIVADDAQTLAEHSGDKWFAHETPEVVVFARSTDDVSKLLRFANENKIPVTARGAGYGYVGSCVPVRRGIALSLARMNRIREVSFADAIAIVEPGVITAELKRPAREQKLFYSPDPAGFDLISLCVGSEGMLGIVTEITVRLLPLPPARATVSASFNSMSEAAAMVQQIFAAGFLPSSLEIADKFTLEAARQDSGAAHVPSGNAHLLVDLDGQDQAVGAEMQKMRNLIQSRKPTALEIAANETDCEKLWALRRQFSNSLRATGLTKLNEDIVVPRSRLVDLIAFAEALSERSGFPIACFGHAGDGNIHINLMADRYNREAAVREKVRGVLDELFAQVLAWGGVITGEHGIGLAKKRWWPEASSEVARGLHQTLKRALDPNNILNPGKFLD